MGFFKTNPYQYYPVDPNRNEWAVGIYHESRYVWKNSLFVDPHGNFVLMRRQKHHHFGNPFFAASIELTLAGWESLNWTVETFQLDMQPGSCVLPHGAGFPVSSGQSEVENFLLNIHRDPSWLQVFFFFVKICWLNRDQCDLLRGFNGIARCRWMKVNSRVAMVPWRV